jgi:hypothetical protein
MKELPEEDQRNPEASDRPQMKQVAGQGTQEGGWRGARVALSEQSTTLRPLD